MPRVGGARRGHVRAFRIASDARSAGAFNGSGVGTAEEIQVHEERVELMECDPLAGAMRERKRFSISREYAIGEASEETHHREIDLAMMRLFGGFSARVFDAYEEAWGLPPGASERTS